MGLQAIFVSYKCYVDWSALLSNMHVRNLKEGQIYLLGVESSYSNHTHTDKTHFVDLLLYNKSFKDAKWTEGGLVVHCF